jgi:mannose-6-phosphate isomerase-like protein (cupin superfamily)
MDRMQQAEILGRLFSAENRTHECTEPPDIAGSRPWSHWSAPVLLERVAYLKKLARFGEGAASEEFKALPGHSAMLSVRLRSGSVEISEGFALLFFVLEGQATVVIGGRTEESSNAGAEPTIIAKIVSGAKQSLRAGDVVHIAAGTPYQLLLAGDKALGYLVIRIRESEEL